MDNKSSSSSKKPKMGWWKIGGFTLGILLIAAAATYALTTRNSAASSGSLGNVPSIGSTSQSAPATMGVGDLVWAQDLPAMFIDHDIIFVILPGNDSNSNNTLTSRISDATAKIEARGARVGTSTLRANDPEFSITMQRLAISQLPAVLAIGKFGNGAIMTGDITEGKLLQTYLTVSQPVCVPGGSSGCCQ